ncbi:MAG: mechanosensitive ion channel domain-containing protein [Gammaproteobacteria bacterium]
MESGSESISGLLNNIDWTHFYQLAADFGLRLFAALAIFIIGRWVARWLSRLLEKGMQKAGTDQTLIVFLRNIVYVGLLTFAIIAAVGQLGVQTTSFLAVLGAAGLAVGLALQGSLANLAAGVLIIIFRPFKLGDFIEAGGIAGTVKAISIFTTTLHTPDNKVIIVPNAQVNSGTITNYSANDTRRVDMVIGVSYGDDLDKVRSVIQQVLAADERVLKDPAPQIAVMALADSSVNFTVRPWAKSADYWGLYFDLQEQIKKRFDKEGISIPFPQQDVYIHQVSS